MSLHRRAAALAKACFDIQPLENRQLLTVLVGNDIFEFRQGDGSRLRAALKGDVIAEFIGAVVDDQNNVILSQLPGRFFTSGQGKTGVNVLGGIGGSDGVTPVSLTGNSPTHITDVEFPTGSIVATTGSANNNQSINIAALAAAADGRTYSFNFAAGVQTGTGGQGQAQQRTLLQLVQHDNATGAGTVRSMFQQATLGEDVMASLIDVNGQSVSLDSVQAVAIDPTINPLTGVAEGLLYAINEENGQSVLYRIDRSTGLAIQLGTIRNTDTSTDLSTVQAMTFDSSGRLFIITQEYDNDPGADASNRDSGPPQNGVPTRSNTDVAFIQINPADGSFTTPDIQVMITGGFEITDLYTALTFDSTTSRFLAAARGQQGQASRLDSFPFTAGAATVNVTQLGAIGGSQVANPVINGLAFAQNISNQRILVGLDISSTTQGGGPLGRLVAINPTNPGLTTVLSEAGVVSPTRGLASFTEPGTTRPLLFSVVGDELIRGSPVTLPLNEAGTTAVTAIRGADFNPIDGLLYFVAEAAGTQQNAVTATQLYTINVDAGNRSAIQNSIGVRNGNFRLDDAERVITSIAWDQTGPASAVLLAAEQEGRLIEVNVNNTNNSRRSAPILLNCTATTGVTGLAFYGDDLTAGLGEDTARREVFVYALQGQGTTSQLLRIRVGDDPTAIVWGPVIDADDTKSPIRGESLEGLTFNTSVINPFTSERGALMATDTATDELVFIDHRLRSPSISLYAVHVLQSDGQAVISLAEVEDSKRSLNDRPMQPFTDSSGEIRAVNARDGKSLIVQANDGTGVIYMGARSVNADCDPDTNDDLIPIISTGIQGPFGAIHAGDGQLPPGVTVAPNVLLPTNIQPPTTGASTDFTSLMLGLNVDRVTAAAVALDGTTILIDSDFVATNGQLNEVSQIALVAPGTTVASIVQNVFLRVPDPNDPNQTIDIGLSDVIAIDFADLDGNGTESLYAIYNIAGTLTLGTLNSDSTSPDFGQFTEIAAVGGATPLTNVRGMSFSPDGTLYVVAANQTTPTSPDQLLTLDSNTGELVSTIGDVVDPNDIAVLVRSIDFDISGNLFGHDITNARLVDIDPQTATAGGVTATGEGSLHAAIGAIAYDPLNDRFVAVDNSLSQDNLGLVQEASLTESAILRPFRGVSASDAIPQDMGRILIGGTITGVIDISGSIDLFYAGWILTGNAAGESLGYNSTFDPDTGTFTSDVTVPGNFRVGGDLRQIVTPDSIGTQTVPANVEVNYLSGFDMVVGGKAGEIRTLEHFVGDVDVINDSGAPSLGTATNEVEVRRFIGENVESVFLPGTFFTTSVEVNFQSGYLRGLGGLSNDNFNDAQYVGAINSDTLGSNVAHIRGNLEGTRDEADTVDWYGVALMAGQTITVQLVDLFSFGRITSPFTSFSDIFIGVFDPDNRLIATDYSDVDFQEAQGQAFRITADRPGVYRFAVGFLDNPDFTNGGEFGGEDLLGVSPYEIRITGVGNIGLGAINADDDIYDGRRDGTSIRVQNGDLGALHADDRLLSTSFVTINDPELLSPGSPPLDPLVGATYEVLNGNLRTLDATSIGRIADNGLAVVQGPHLDVPEGSVGLIQATGTGATDGLEINEDFFLASIPGGSSTTLTVAIGGDYQVIHSANQLYGNYWANGSIGLVRGANATLRNVAGSFVVNADQRGAPGIIDMINFSGDLGTISAGGPAIMTGPGGNVRYMNVGGIAFRDEFFGGGAPEETLFRPGESVTLRDDSGAPIEIDPSGTDQLRVTTYGIRGSGGSAIVRVISSGSVTLRGLGNAADAGIEIGQVIVNGAGEPVVLDPTGRPQLQPTGTPLFVQVTGNSKVDILEVSGGAFSFIDNDTDGEIVNVTATSIGRIESGNIGVATRSTPVAVNPLGVRSNVYPFNQEHVGVVSGSIVTMSAKHAIGNIIVSGSIGRITADSDNLRPKRLFDGIAGSIFATGELFEVNIGAGVLPSGSGNLARAGIFANGPIRQISGRAADIRGNIVSQNRIDRIRLTDGGSIINANVEVLTSLDMTREFFTFADRTKSNPDIGDPISNPIFEIGEILVETTRTKRGQQVLGGGIIGISVSGADIGKTIVRNGFGLFNSSYTIVGDGVIDEFVIDGYGIRDVQIMAGASINRIIATGTGKALPTSGFSTSVRASENRSFDQFFGTPPNRITDLHANLGTSRKTPLIRGITNAGIIAGTSVRAGRDLNELKAWQVRDTRRTISDGMGGSFVIRRTAEFNIANSIKRFTTLSDVINISIVAGFADRFIIGRNAQELSYTIAGVTNFLQIKGFVDRLSLIRGIGPDGELKQVLIGGTVFGDIFAKRRIGSIQVDGEPEIGPQGSIISGRRAVNPK